VGAEPFGNDHSPQELLDVDAFRLRSATEDLVHRWVDDEHELLGGPVAARFIGRVSSASEFIIFYGMSLSR